MEVFEPFTFHHPCTISISGPSGSGKTVLTIDILNNLSKIFRPPPVDVTFFYSEWQSNYEEISPRPLFIKGVPTKERIESINRPSLFIVDDSMGDINQTIVDIFTKYSHHKDLSLILLLQNFHNRGHHQRTINLNTNYIVFMKNPRNKLAVTYMSREIFPNRMKYVMESFDDATKLPYSYLLFDLKQETPDKMRLVTNILPKPGTYQYFYIPVR